MKKTMYTLVIVCLSLSLIACNVNTIPPSSSDSSNEDYKVEFLEKPELIDIPDGGILLLESGDGIIITATSITRDRKNYITGIDVLIENNSEVEKVVAIWPDAAFGGPIIINGYSMNCSFYETVASDKKSVATVRFQSDTVELLEMTNLYEAVIPFGTYESKDDFMKHNITTYDPVVLAIGDYEARPTGIEAYNENGVEIYMCGFEKSLLRNKAVIVVKNDMGFNRSFSLDSISINGMMTKSSETIDLYDGTYGVIKITLDDDYNDSNVEEIEFTLKARGFNEIISLDTETVDIITLTY